MSKNRWLIKLIAFNTLPSEIDDNSEIDAATLDNTNSTSINLSVMGMYQSLDGFQTTKWSGGINKMDGDIYHTFDPELEQLNFTTEGGDIAVLEDLINPKNFKYVCIQNINYPNPFHHINTYALIVSIAGYDKSNKNGYLVVKLKLRRYKDG